MTCCQGLQTFQTPAVTESGKLPWIEQKSLKCQPGNVTCGMLPTLRVLASTGCNSQGSVCLVPFDVQMDSASHLQMILLEAYCRETGIKVLRVSRDTLSKYLRPDTVDHSCVLITNDDPYFLETPE